MNHSHAIDWFDGGFFVALIFIDCSGFIERTISLSVSWELCGFICLHFCCLLQRHYIPIEQRTVHTATTVLCSLSIFNGIKTEREREWIHVYASIKIPQFKSVRNTSMRNSWAIGFKIFDMYRKFSLLKMISSHFFHIFHFHCIYINNVKINEILRLLCNLI